MSGRPVRGSRTVASSVASVALLAVLALVVGCSSDDSDPVAVAEVERGTVEEVVEAPGTITPRAVASVDSPADGRVTRLLVEDGARVRAGEIVMRLRSPSAERTLASAIATDAEAAAAVGEPASSLDSSADVDRADAATERAFAQAEDAVDALAPGELRRAARAQLAANRAQYAAARASVTQALDQLDAGVGSASAAAASLARAQRVQTRAAVAAAQRTVDALTVRAPIAGTVSLGGGATGGSEGSGTGEASALLGGLPASQQALAESLLGGGSGGASTAGEIRSGAPVSAGDPLFSVTNTSRMAVLAQVDETDVLLVDRGVPATVELSAVPGASYGARVTAVGLEPTTSTRGGVTYRVRLRLGAGTTADGAVAPRPRPGMSAVVRLRVRTAEGVVSAPAAAVFQDAGRPSVWLVVDGVAHRQPVRVGAQGEASYEIVDGLEAGDVVVVRGADTVREGQHVG